MKKSFVFGMIAAAAMLASCGGNTPASTTPAASTPAATSSAPAATSSVAPAASSEAAPAVESSKAEEVVTKKYEIVGVYDELYSQFAAFEFYGELNSDGKGILYEATVTSKGETANVVTPDEGVAINYKVEDDDGILTLTAAINGQRVTGYPNKDGAFEVGYSFTFAGTYTREAKLYISETFVYDDLADWTEKKQEEYDNKVVEVTVSNSFSGEVKKASDNQQLEITLMGNVAGVTAQLDLMSDMTAVLKYGVAFGGSFYGGDEKNGTWTADPTTKAFSVTLGDDTISSSTDASGLTSFHYEFEFVIEVEDQEPTSEQVYVDLAGEVAA